jgi:dethiobiotin synthetase
VAAGRLVVVSGTGTEIGKTHLAEALLLAWRAGGVRAAGVKPVESGVTGDALTDARRLQRASAFHVKPSPYVFADPISPHLAARREGVVIRPEAIAAWLADLRPRADVLLVELPGGLFSPLGEGLLNAGLAAVLHPDRLLLVAPDRLGVIHDVVAATRAAAGVPLSIDAVALVPPERTDASTTTNAGELARFIACPVFPPGPRAAPETMAASAAVRATAQALLR